MTKKQKAEILYPAWLTKEQAEMLRHAEQGELPSGIQEQFKKVLDPATRFEGAEVQVVDHTWDGREDKTEIIKFTDTPSNRTIDFFQRKFGRDFGLILCFRFMDYKYSPKPEAEKRSLQVMRWFAVMDKYDKTARLKEKYLTLLGDFIKP